MLLGHINIWRYVPFSNYLSWFFSSDFEFQTASCWIAAGSSAMLVTLTRRTPAILVAVAMLCLLAVVLPATLFNFVTNNQELTVAFVIPANPGASAAKPPHVVSTGPRRFIGRRQMQWKPMPGGTAQCGTSRPIPRSRNRSLRHREEGLQIIVLNPPVPAHALLPQPDGTEFMYISQPDGWRTIPAQAERSVALLRFEGQKRTTMDGILLDLRRGQIRFRRSNLARPTCFLSVPFLQRGTTSPAAARLPVARLGVGSSSSVASGSERRRASSSR